PPPAALQTQGAESILGPIQQVGSPSDLASADPSETEQQKGEKESEKKDQNDDGSTDPSLGLINSGPVQLKTDLEQPVTSGGMNTMIDNPGTSN
ncbi:MAG TPA: hypothetical protein VNR86_04255, partial [Sphingomicrobium sp.]|nr:hypothetical protein [Sphingomicrobium sp.]